MNNESVTLFKDYFPDLYQSIITNFNQTKKNNILDLKKVFDTFRREIIDYPDFLQTKKVLSISVNGYTNITDMPNQATGILRIYYGGAIIDEYDIMISYNATDRKSTRLNSSHT